MLLCFYQTPEGIVTTALRALEVLDRDPYKAHILLDLSSPFAKVRLPTGAHPFPSFSQMKQRSFFAAALQKYRGIDQLS